MIDADVSLEDGKIELVAKEARGVTRQLNNCFCLAGRAELNALFPIDPANVFLPPLVEPSRFRADLPFTVRLYEPIIALHVFPVCSMGKRIALMAALVDSGRVRGRLQLRAISEHC